MLDKSTADYRSLKSTFRLLQYHRAPCWCPAQLYTARGFRRPRPVRFSLLENVTKTRQEDVMPDFDYCSLRITFAWLINCW